VRPDYCGLEPMDLSASRIRASARITPVPRDAVVEDADDGLELTVEEVPIGPATARCIAAGHTGLHRDHSARPARSTPRTFPYARRLFADGQQRIGMP